MPIIRVMIAFTSVWAALLGGPAAAQDTSSALSTILQTAKSDEHSAYLVTAEGRPIYVFSADTPRSAGVDASSLCSDACTQEWPPLTANAGAVASPEIDIALISKMQRQDGASQVLFGGHPVYIFAGDQPGEPPTGHGRSAHGGVWQLVKPDGIPIAPEG